MRVLTVQQPWAWAIFHGKDVENRTQAWGYRGPLAIHAGARWSDRGGASPLCRAAAGLGTREMWPDDLAEGAVLGVVQLVDVHQAEPLADCCRSMWAEQSYTEHGGRERRRIVHLVLEDPVEFATPIANVRGRLGLWTPDPDLADAITTQLGATS